MGVNGIYGLSGSGLDVESMVKVGMMAKQNEYDKMQQKYTKNEWKKSEFLSLYGEVQTFNNSTLSQYKMSSNMNARSATSANNNIVTATANASAAQMTHYVEVDKLATSAYLVGTKLDRANTEDSTVQNQLQSILFSQMDIDSNGKISVNGGSDSFEAGDVAFSFSLNDGVNGLAVSSNEDAVTAYASSYAETEGTHTITISQVATSASSTGVLTTGMTENSRVVNSISNSDVQTYLKNHATSTDTALTYTFSDGKNSANISFSFKDINDTLENFVANLNSKFERAGLTLEADYTSDGDGKGGISLKNTEVGSSNTFTISASYIDSGLSAVSNSGQSGYLAKVLFLGNNSTPYNTSNNFSYTVNNGTNAKGEIDNSGTEVEFDGNTYTDTDSGITYTAKTVTTEAVEIKNPGSLNINVTYGDLYNGFTFSELTSKINALGTNVRASYDSVQDRFYFYNKNSGAENNVTFNIAKNDGTNSIGDNTVKFFESLGLKQSSNGEVKESDMVFEAGKSATQAGSDAKVTIDGVSYDLDSNKTTVNGVVYNFQNLTNENTGRIAVTVTQDTAAIASKVKSFVDDYNALMTKLYKWYDEKPNSNYTPLSETQKSGMKDEQIEKWEEKAKAGLLYHDKTLGNLITEMRSAVSGNVGGVNGKYNNIFSIGISTTGLKGQLSIDEDKLNTALAEDPDAVYNIFAKLDSGEKQYWVQDESGKKFWTTDPYKENLTILKNDDGKDITQTIERPTYNGIAQRLGDIFVAGMKNIKAVSGSSAEITEDSELNNLLRELQTKMSNFQTMMKAFESKLYKKYDAMESSLALLGAQLNYVTGAFSQ
ncbi:MAG: flagellar filament capping protein FliD [Selenomonadaceae bacterium]|nr:flagellar filament capping protein FliD [Selenomonadaceae bacterium]